MQWEKGIDELVKETQEAAAKVGGQRTYQKLDVSASVLATPQGAAFMRYIAQASRDACEAGKDALNVGFRGGWSGVAKACGYGAEENLMFKRIMVAGTGLVLKLGRHKHTGLWTLTYYRKSKRIELTIGCLLAPRPL